MMGITGNCGNTEQRLRRVVPRRLAKTPPEQRATQNP